MSGLALGLALLAGCSKPAADSGRSPPPQRDLIMISIDTLRRDSVGRYDGSDRTPFLDSLLAQGLTLDAHHACSNWTYGSILCGLGGADGVDVGWVPYARIRRSRSRGTSTCCRGSCRSRGSGWGW
jgi:hypothetical protein